VADKDCNQQARPYSKPTLTVYGKVTELTTIVGNKQAFDSTVKGKNGPKTGFA
jgi:hypothetical protein